MSAQALKEVLEAQLAPYDEQRKRVHELLDEGWVLVGMIGDMVKLQEPTEW